MSSQLASSHPKSSAPKPPSRINSAFKQLWSIHWWMAACYLLLFMGGIWMDAMANPWRGHAYTFHKSIGVLTMGLLLWRIAVLQRVWWKKYTRRLPQVSGEWLRTVALHTAIYIFMLAAPLSGIFLSNSFRAGNVPFFWITLPDLFPVNSDVVGLARDLHFWLTYTFLGFIVLHALDQRKYVRSLLRRSLKAFQKARLSQ